MPHDILYSIYRLKFLIGMPKIADFSQGFLIAAVILYICVFVYAIHHDFSKESELTRINQTLDAYHSENRHFEDLEVIIKGVLEKKDREKSLFKKLINSGKTGFFVGCLSGTITGGPAGSLATGIVFGLINPIVTVINEILHVSEELSIAKITREKEIARKMLGRFSHLPQY